MSDPRLLKAGLRFGAGRFTLVRALGRGGMGEVWLAQDARLHEPVALKFLPPEIHGDARALDDSRRETARSHKLTHPNIVRIHDLNEVEGEPAFIAMEYIDGPTLTGLQLQQASRALPWEMLKPLVRQLCAALDYAHGEGVIHRDLKPANIMVDSKGRLKLADFGIAATVSDSVSRVSRHHSTSGTLLYMSPQQLTGKHPQAADDIYALGATLYELLTSRPPFFTGDITYQVLHEAPEPPQERLAALGIQNDLPADVSAIIMACLAKEPAQRPQSVRAVAEWIGLEVVSKPSLQSLADAIFSSSEAGNPPRAAAPAKPRERVPADARKRAVRPGAIWAIAGIAVAAIGGALVFHHRAGVRPPPKSSQAQGQLERRRTDGSTEAPVSDSSQETSSAHGDSPSPPATAAPHNFGAWPGFIEGRLGASTAGGYAFAVRDHGELAASGTGGYARMPWEKQAPGTRWTLDKTMWVGDSGFTAAALMKLWEEKKFALDDPFWPYVKNLFPNAHETVREISLRHLLTHRSGLSGDFDTLQAGKANDQRRILEKAAAVLGRPVKNPPGTSNDGFRWSNAYFLGLVIERISGETYTQYIKRHLLTPVGAARTDTRADPDSRMLGYGSEWVAKRIPGFAFAWETPEANGAKFWFASAGEWSAVLAGLADGRILSPEASRLLFDTGMWGSPVRKNGRLIGYSQGASWTWNPISRAGHMKCAAIHFTDGVDAALLINSGDGDAQGLLVQAWAL